MEMWFRSGKCGGFGMIISLDGVRRYIGSVMNLQLSKLRSVMNDMK